MMNVTIVGGGITGLSLAYILATHGQKVRVLESSSKVGGLLKGFEIAGNRLEHFYHHFFTHDAELLWLLKELNIEHKAQFFKGSMAMFRNQGLHSFSGPIDLLKLPFLSWPAKIRFALTSLLISKKNNWQDYEKTSALAWLSQRAGSEVVNKIWEPLFNIKFGKHAEEIPLTWLIGRLSQRAKSRKGTQELLGYIENGFESISEALEQRCLEMGVSIYCDAKVESIKKDSQFEIQSNKGLFKSERLVFTQANPLVKELVRVPFPQLHTSLSEIEYFGAVCVILELNQSLSPYYWINVCDDGHPFGGIIEHTNLLPKSWYQNHSLIYLSRYFTQDENIATQTDTDIKKDFIESLANIFPAFQEGHLVSSHVFKTRFAAPVCKKDFSKGVAQIKTNVEGLFMANMCHVYPDERSTNNSIRVAAETARCMGYDTSAIPKGLNLAGLVGI